MTYYKIVEGVPAEIDSQEAQQLIKNEKPILLYLPNLINVYFNIGYPSGWNELISSSTYNNYCPYHYYIGKYNNCYNIETLFPINKVSFKVK